jgi:hypothetical protein
MNHSQKIGGVSALIDAATFVVGFILLFTVLDPTVSGDHDPAQKVAFLVDNQTVMYIFNLVIYVVFGIFLVIVALALLDRLKAGSPGMAQAATAYGLIWAGLVIASGMVANIGAAAAVALHGEDPAQAAPVWLAIDTVREGLGGGNEIVGGLWVLLVSWAALRANEFSKIMNYLGVLAGLAGLITIIPALGEPGGAVFGLGLIVWFVWLGINMLRYRPDAARRKSIVEESNR